MSRVGQELLLSPVGNGMPNAPLFSSGGRSAKRGDHHMAKGKSKSSSKGTRSHRKPGTSVGASREAARKVGGKGDFGTSADRARPASRRVKGRPERPSQRSGEEGQRVVGVGAVGATPGKSGGEADTDILGVGTPGGSSVSTEGTLGRKKGKDLTTKGGAAPFGSGRPSKTKAQDLIGKVGGDKRVRGTTHNAGSGEGGEGVGDIVDRAQAETYDPNIGGT